MQDPELRGSTERAKRQHDDPARRNLQDSPAMEASLRVVGAFTYIYPLLGAKSKGLYEASKNKKGRGWSKSVSTAESLSYMTVGAHNSSP